MPTDFALQLGLPKKHGVGQRPACDVPMFLAALSSRAIPSFPKSSLARRWASSQAVLAEGLVSENSRDDWHSFEPLIAAFVDAVLSPTPETVVATQVVKLTA